MLMKRLPQERQGKGRGHRATHMGAWVPSKLTLRAKDVASVNVVA